MFPFKVILIGKDEQLLPQLRRELLNQAAEVDCEFTDMAAAVERLAIPHDEARLFLIQVCDVEQLDYLKHFSGTFSGRPILVVLPDGADSTWVVKAMRHGASQALIAPVVDADFAEALDGTLVQFGHLVSQGRIIAVTGAHGGVGVTSVAVNLAYEIAQQYQLNTLLIELQLNVGVLSSFLQIEPKHSTTELLKMGHSMDLYAIKSSMVPFGERLSVLAGPAHNKGPLTIESETITYLIQAASRLADVVVVDVPASLDHLQLDVVRLANKVLVVTEQTIPSLQLTIELLQLGLRAQSPAVVVNRFDDTIDGFDANHIQDVLGLADSRFVMNDHAGFHAAINQGHPLRLAAPDSPAIPNFSSLAAYVLESAAVRYEKHARASIFSRLTHLLGVDGD